MSAAPILDGSGRAVGVVCFGPALEEYNRKPHGESRWCFVCRARRAFELVVSVPYEPSYYGPTADIECSVCHHSDADLFPGRFREWVEPEWGDE